ncbi:cytoplasmic tRNA 2-thiolation protein 2-B-like isoform X2 [Varroa jacobsoni]|nr:cytoplasmic tRNA 2-thiolation protein 2-B-like isoform X2 [Varroa jacobsoni]XP_022704750.1 cytoplasmic tRNA 2-thiolation protein 2-B-like isoform X2 [Varroa jacobsoni]
MCSNSGNPELLLQHPLDEAQAAKTRNCTCCQGPAVLVIRRVNGYCLSCYQETCRHKFRATIGKSKKIIPGDRVLVWLSPPLGAVAAVALLEESRQDTLHKKLQFDFEYAIIDGQQESIDLANFGSSAQLHRVTSPVDTPPQRNSTLRMAHQAIEALKAVIQFAKANSFNKVFTCETGGDLAQQMLISVALGRGCQLPDITGLSVERDGVTLLRPLREFSDEEIEKYLFSGDLPVPVTPKLPAGIQRLTRDFVNGLQAEFPSTVPTIWRTADKVSALSTNSVTCDLCGYCFWDGSLTPPTDVKSTSVKEVYGAVDALRISAQLSTTLKLESTDSVAKRCYSCRQINVVQ